MLIETEQELHVLNHKKLSADLELRKVKVATLEEQLGKAENYIFRKQHSEIIFIVL